MKKITVVTHSGPYHADDLFAAATLSLFLSAQGEKIEITRTRDESIIEAADYVIDVGGVYDEAHFRFDHHQSGGAGSRTNGVPYASFGLVWKFCGEKLCGSKMIAGQIDEKIVQAIDAHDNGFDIADPKIKGVDHYTIQNFFYAFRPTWKEDTSMDAVFMELIELAKAILAREITRALDKEEAKAFVEKAYADAEDKRLIVLDGFWPWTDVIAEHKEPLYIVFKERSEDKWCARAVQENDQLFKNRKDFPLKWAGKRDAELATITGVSDAIFCHNKLFMVATHSKEGAIQLAKLALEA
jgi:uncharacterized UPF0160 family protein